VDVPFRVYSLYVQDQFQPIENLSLTVGVRRDEYSTVGSTTTPRIAIIYNPTPASTMKFLYGEAFRAPNVYEVYYEDPIGGAKRNTGLVSEKIRTSEFIFEHRVTDLFYATFSTYHYEMNNLIDQTLDPTDSLLQFQNRSDVFADGAEIELRALLKNGFRARISYSIQHVEDASTAFRLSNSPARLLKMNIAYPLTTYFYAAMEFLGESERMTVYGTTTSPVVITNASLWLRPAIVTQSALSDLLNNIECSVTIRNLFNTPYQTPGGFEHVQPSIPQDGRNITARLEYKF